MSMESQAIPSRVDVLGSHYSRCLFDEVAEKVMDRGLAHKSGYVCVSNVHTTMMGYFDSEYQKITNESFMSVPDGMPIRWAMNLLGSPEQDRVRGPALMRAVCDRGRTKGVKHFLYGGSPKALDRLQAYLQKEYPGVEIVGAISPPFRPLTEEEIAKDMDAINASGAHILWVGLGAPKQERWMGAHSKKINGVCLGVGAAFDLLPGVVQEAPLWIQNLGMEWFYRLLMEPRRLWRRYIFNNPAFVILLLFQFCRYRIRRLSYGSK